MFKFPVDPELESYLMSRTDAEEAIGLAHNMLVNLYEHCEQGYAECETSQQQNRLCRIQWRVKDAMNLLRDAANIMRPGFVEACEKKLRENDIDSMMHL